MTVSQRKIVIILLALAAMISFENTFIFDTVVAETMHPKESTVKEIYRAGSGLPVGKIQLVEGDVLIFHADTTDAYRAKIGLPLFKGDNLVVWENGRIGAKLTDGSTFVLTPETNLIVDKSVHDSVRKSSISILSLVAGRAYFQQKKLIGFEPREFRVMTEFIIAGGREGEFIVEVIGEAAEVTALGNTLLEVMSLADPEKKIFLSEFQRARFGEGELPSSVELIPPAQVHQLIDEFQHVRQSNLSESMYNKFGRPSRDESEVDAEGDTEIKSIFEER